MLTFAQKKRLLALSLWACGFLVVGYLFFPKVKEKNFATTTDDQCLEIPRDNLLSKSLRKDSGCTDKNTAIYAHYIQQTMNDTVCFLDILNNQDGEMSCSPGPYRSEGRAIDPSSGPWTLASTPDYFVWHLSADSLEQNIYITNQNGFPIKSQVIRLQSEDEATMVLLPKAVLDKGSTYYIYLTFNQNHDKQTWVQPITISARAEDQIEVR